MSILAAQALVSVFSVVTFAAALRLRSRSYVVRIAFPHE
jgi:hypothetical protein